MDKNFISKKSIIDKMDKISYFKKINDKFWWKKLFLYSCDE